MLACNSSARDSGSNARNGERMATWVPPTIGIFDPALISASVSGLRVMTMSGEIR
jgi:hypothetical protein